MARRGERAVSLDRAANAAVELALPLPVVLLLQRERADALRGQRFDHRVRSGIKRGNSTRIYDFLEVSDNTLPMVHLLSDRTIRLLPEESAGPLLLDNGDLGIDLRFEDPQHQRSGDDGAKQYGQDKTRQRHRPAAVTRGRD